MSDIRNLIFAPGTQGPPGPGTSGSGGITSGANVSLAGLPIFNAGQSTSTVLKFNTLLAGPNVGIVNNNDGTLTISSVVNLDQGQGVVPIANLPIANSTQFGIVKPDNTTISITSGVLSAILNVPVTSVFGRTGDILAESGDYDFSLIDGIVAPSQLPVGTDAAFGAFKVDGTTITATGGVLAVVPQGSTLPMLSAFTFLGNATNSPAVAAETALLRLGNLDEVLVLQNLGAQDFSVALPATDGNASISGFKSPAGKDLLMNFYTDVGPSYPYNDYTQYGGYFQIQVQSLSSGKQTVLTNWNGDLSLSAYDSANTVPANLFLNTTNVKVNAASQFVLTPVGTLPVTLEDGALETSGDFVYITIDGVRYIIGSKGQEFDAAFVRTTVSDGFSIVAADTVSRVFLNETSEAEMASGSIQFPVAVSDGQIFSISTNATVDILTLTTTTGAIDGPSTIYLPQRASASYEWSATDSTWYAMVIPRPKEKFHDYGDVSGTVTCDPNLYDAACVTLTADTTISIADLIDSEAIGGFTLIVRSNGFNATFDNISWSADTAPTLTTTVGKKDVLVFVKYPMTTFNRWAGGLSLANVSDFT